VDDNATNCKILSLQAKGWGMQPFAVQAPPEALQLITQGERFDLAILDMQMPGMDGLTLGQELKQKCPALPLVLLTSLDQEQADVRLQQFAARLPKPIRQEQLCSHLLKAIGLAPLSTPAAIAAVPPVVPDNSALRILLAEDNVINQKVAVQILTKKLGYARVDVVANGLEVLAALSRQSYDVVLMDMQMPEMDGLEATRQIRQQWSSASLPVIAMTANASKDDQAKCQEVGMDGYVCKPIRIEDLQGILAAIVIQ
jgi:CheY-like chemotaxis protein